MVNIYHTALQCNTDAHMVTDSINYLNSFTAVDPWRTSGQVLAWRMDQLNKCQIHHPSQVLPHSGQMSYYKYCLESPGLSVLAQFLDQPWNFFGETLDLLTY